MAEVRIGKRPAASDPAESRASDGLASSVNDCIKSFQAIASSAGNLAAPLNSMINGRLSAQIPAGQMDIQLQAGIGNEKMPISSGIAAIGGQLAAMSTGSDYIIDFYGRGSEQMPIFEKIQSIQDEIDAAFADPIVQNIDFQAGTGRGGRRGQKGHSISSGISTTQSLISGYVEAMGNLAFDRSIGASDDLSQYGVSAYQAQVTAYQRLLGIGGGGASFSPGGPSSAGTGGVNIIIENITINGADTSDPVDLATKFDEAISDKIKRGTSEIPPALKAAGL
ncbi:MAG: hypothetical protein M0Z52_10545 [Actinomycetota bacterium]|nr:hypothetical protein [Actinomycetota bacterium]